MFTPRTKMTIISRATFICKKAVSAEKKAKRMAKRKEIWKTAPMRLTRTALRAALDKLWGFIILLRHRAKFGPLCRICRTNPATVGYHIVPKQRGDSIRWDLENGCGACSPCNGAEYQNRSLYQDVRHPDIFGHELIAKLKDKARTTADFSMADLVEMRDFFKKMIETGAWKL